MGLSNLFSKRLILLALVLWAGLCQAQTNVTVIPGKLKVLFTPNTPAVGDMMVTMDAAGNIKKDTIRSGGTTAIGANGITGTGILGLGGTLNQNTTINTGSFNFVINGGVGTVFNRTGSGSNIAVFQTAGAIQSEIVTQGDLHGPGIANYPNGRLTSFVNTSAAGTFITRDTADNNQTLTVRAISSGATGDIARFQNYLMTLGGIQKDGTFYLVPLTAATAGKATAMSITGMLKPTANSDVLTGLIIRPVFGTSSIGSINTLVGGTGYTNGVSYALLSGGTGVFATAKITVTAGVVTAITLIDSGVNYSNGDILTIGGGTGGTVTVASIVTRTGVINYALQTFGLDQYDIDYSSTYTARSKTDKAYVDGRIISNSYSTVGSATTAFTVTFGVTMANNTYKVHVTPTTVNGITGFYVTNKTTTTFQIVYPSGVSGAISWDYSVAK